MPSILSATNIFLAVNSAFTAKFVGKSTVGGEDRPKSAHAVQRKKKKKIVGFNFLIIAHNVSVMRGHDFLTILYLTIRWM